MRVTGGDWRNAADRLRRRAADLAGPLARAASGSTTLAQQRAILRLLGVDGLDRLGRPLAGAVVDTYCAGDPKRLAHGVGLPFAVALLEYDLPPRELALEAAAGSVDLALEAELLERPERREAAQRLAASLVDAAFARVDANRTASREMRSVLGDPPQPWLGLALGSLEVAAAERELRQLIGAGADVVRIRVPASWELEQARRHAGLDAAGPDIGDLTAGSSRWSPGDGPAAPPRRRGEGATNGGRGGGPARTPAGETGSLATLKRAGRSEPVPAGSQRGLGALRAAADEAAAERGTYAALMTVTSAFAAPEQAVVAALERIDLVEADPIREIVDDNVDPDRAIADHAFAHRLQARAGCRVVIGAGPLALGADLVSGIPSDAPTRAGRALALQSLGVELALAGGLGSNSVLVGALPSWLPGEGDATGIVVGTWLRRLVFRGHGLVLDGLPTEARSGLGALALVAALGADASAGYAGAATLVLREAGEGRAAEGVQLAVAELRATAAAARSLGADLADGDLHGRAADLAAETLRAADLALERLAGEGWEVLLGPPGQELDRARLGHAAVVPRIAGRDPFEALHPIAR